MSYSLCTHSFHMAKDSGVEGALSSELLTQKRLLDQKYLYLTLPSEK